MRVLRKDLKEGEVKLLIQSQDDLWHLYNLVDAEDIVFSTTFRREDKIDGKLRAERMEKKRVKLGIRVEEVKFQEFSDKLRIHGKIEEGEDKGSYHTFNIGLQDSLSVIKEEGWKPYQLERIEEAVATSYAPMITFVAIEYDEALLAQLFQYGVKELATIRSRVSGKQYPSDYSKEDFYLEILDKLKKMDVGDAVIIVGPGFTKDDFNRFIKSRSFVEKVYVYSAAQGGMLGIQEVLRSGISKVLEEHRVAFEAQIVEKFLAEIAKDGMFSYGFDEVKRAIELGAVETLLISTDMMREDRFEPLLKTADAKKGRIVSISPHHEAGRKLKNMGGVGALLRFKI